MHAVIISVMLLSLCIAPVYAQQTDSIREIDLEVVTIVADSYQKKGQLTSALPVETVGKDFLSEHFTGNLIQALEHVPGVRSMDIGVGLSKPMIRGMAFNRIVVVENGVRQEGQQWGSDHGLEIDVFDVERAVVRKGPSSLLYGSDAMGGAIEIAPLPPPREDRLSGEVTTLYKSVNQGWGGSLRLDVRKGAWYAKFRYSEQQFGDYRIPADTMVYLTQRVPIYGRKLKNTAGVERYVNGYVVYRRGSYSSQYRVGRAYQKNGFFPGAHGIPDRSRVEDDGNDRNVGLPHSLVSHFKLSSRQQYLWGNLTGWWDVGYQRNDRDEMSAFHTHYSKQSPPTVEPDKELSFSLSTYSSSFRFSAAASPDWEHSVGWDVQYQQNRIGGYAFLLPRYDRLTTGLSGVSVWTISPAFSLSGGVRYDYGQVAIAANRDPFLEAYLKEMGYADELMEQYKWRSYPVERSFGDFSGSLGWIWRLSPACLLKANLGHSFRLPGANELSSNGVHHGAFRHEQGDPSLASERGWQLDASYYYESKRLSFSASPFFGWFANYIYLRPTGEWSVLPHAGQIYRYTGAKAVFAGVELSFSATLFPHLRYSFSGEYVYAYNRDERVPLSFSPPASMRNALRWKKKRYQVYGEVLSIAPQYKVSKNEAATPGANLVQLGGSLAIPMGKTTIDVGVSLHNLLNTMYYNHLSFYRKVEIPEPGRNIRLVINVPFTSKLK